MTSFLVRNRLKFSLVGLFFATFFLWQIAATLPDGKLHLKVYDVSQGDAIFVETASGYRILIDGGPDNRVLEYLGQDLPFYSRKIDLLVLTHPQADHLTGLIEVVKRYQINTLWLGNSENKTKTFEEWKKAIDDQNINTRIVSKGDILNLPDKTKL